LDRVHEIIEATLGCRILALDRKNVNCPVTLIRIETERGSYWFKSVGNDDLGEFRLSRYLHQHFPGFVPEIVSSYPQWGGWLLKQVDGHTFADIHDVRVWCDVFTRFAQLQVRSIAHRSHLIDAGAACWTIGRMRNMLGKFFIDMSAVMSRQQKEPPARLSAQDLRELHMRMEACCFEMESLAVPDTLLHGDLCPQNIILSDHGPVFLDWAELYMGNPFLGGELLLRYFRRHCQADDTTAAEMRDAFNDPWLGLNSRETVQRAWQLAACLAPLLNALYLPLVSAHSAIGADKRDAFLRTLVRVMKHESEYPEAIAC
jgi:Phosphotransferase enzyme family